MDTGSPALDLAAYLDRIGYAGPLAPTRSVLDALHLAHVTGIPFENLDIQLGRPVRLDLASLQEKLVAGRRGGYCFEQNTLFAAALRAIGFQVTTLAARVRYQATAVTPRTHMIVKVDLPEGPLLADVGFGGRGLTTPLRLATDEVQRSLLDIYRLRKDGGLTALQVMHEGVFHDLYAFSEEEHHPVDYEMGSHYTSTYPTSRFVLNLIAVRTAPHGRSVLFNRSLTLPGQDAAARRELGDDELIEALRQHFGLHVPEGARFRCLATTAE